MDNVSYGFICITLLIIGTLMSLYWYYTSQSHIVKRLRRFLEIDMAIRIIGIRMIKC